MTVNTAWDALQLRAHDQIWRAIDNHNIATACVAPTGFGKTRTSIMSIQTAEARGLKWVFYTNRVSLFAQTAGVFSSAGIDFATRASGYSKVGIATKNGQLAMMPTEQSRLKKGDTLHDANIVFVDEAHLLSKGKSRKLIEMHMAEGSQIIGLTATPVGMGGLFQNMEILATKAELRAVGGMVPFECWAPFEADLKDIKKVPPGKDMPIEDQAKIFKSQQVVGGIIDYYMKLNPNGYPTLGFGPDVASCRYMVDEFRKAGITAASVDGEDIYYGDRDMDDNAELLKSTVGARQDLFEKSRLRQVEVIWSRYVMREGVDLPWVRHEILACVVGAVTTFDQMVGRGGRASPGKIKCTIQDHGGNFYRAGLGNPNADREWSLSMTNESIAKEAEAARKAGPNGTPPDPNDLPPVACQKCHKMYPRADFFKKFRGICQKCGFQHDKTPHRPIMQTSGKLRFVSGDPKIKKPTPEFQKEWDGLFFKTKNSKSAKHKDFMVIKAEFERNNPRYEVILDHRKGVTLVRDRNVNQTFTLGRAPKPGSLHWTKSPASVDFKDLQYPQKAD